VQALLELVGAEQLNGEIDDATAARLAGADLLFAVTKHNPKEVIQQLARMLTAVDHKRAATATIKAFGMYGYRSVRPILKLKTEALMRVTGTEPQFPMFRDADERGVGGKAWEVAPDEVVDRCHRVLEHAGGDALTEMLEIIRQPGNDTLRAVTIDTVTPLLPGNEDEAIPVLVDQLSDPVTAPKARELILSLKPHPRAAVPELLGDSFLQGGTAEADDKRKKLTDYIEALKGDGLPLIEHLLSHPEPTIQRTAVRLLSKLAPAERDALDVAIKALGCSDRTARNSAITTILIYGRAAIPKLQPLARETNRNVTIREGAKQALSLLGAG